MAGHCFIRDISCIFCKVLSGFSLMQLYCKKWKIAGRSPVSTLIKQECHVFSLLEQQLSYTAPRDIIRDEKMH